MEQENKDSIVTNSELEVKVARLAIGNLVTCLGELDMALDALSEEWGVEPEDIVRAAENLARNNGYDEDFVTVTDSTDGAIYCANCGRQVGVIPSCPHCGREDK